MEVIALLFSSVPIVVGIAMVLHSFDHTPNHKWTLVGGVVFIVLGLILAIGGAK